MTRSEFEHEVHEKGAHLSPEARTFAIDHFVNVESIQQASISKCVQLAGHYQGWLDENAAREPQEVHSSRPELEVTAISDVTRREWIRRLEPWVRSVRQDVFGKADAPFSPDAWDKAVQWIRSVESAPSGAAPFELRRLTRLQRQTAELAKTTGIPLRLTLEPLVPLAYAKPTSASPKDEPVTPSAEHVAWISFLRPGDPLHRLATVAEAIAALCGAAAHEVTTWILAGTPPRTPRSRVLGRVVSRAEPDGQIEQAHQVVVEFFTPDIRVDDLRKLRVEIKHTWEALRTTSDPRHARNQARDQARLQSRADARRLFSHTAVRAPGGVGIRLRLVESEDFRRGRTLREMLEASDISTVAGAAKPRPKGRLTRGDADLIAVMDEIGDVPPRPTHEFWRKVLRRWIEAGHDASSPDEHTAAHALRKRWVRIKKKPRPS